MWLCMAACVVIALVYHLIHSIGATLRERTSEEQRLPGVSGLEVSSGIVTEGTVQAQTVLSPVRAAAPIGVQYNEQCSGNGPFPSYPLCHPSR